MKTEKKLKLNTLSSNELASKEANQIKGGRPICTCYCYCNGAEERFFLRMDERNFVRLDFVP
ncbi:MAG: rSAM-modified peptide [Bacteroidales bacterium]|nr:MAG: rSAM-modified peptide [Bacteroidales bacterium]